MDTPVEFQFLCNDLALNRTTRYESHGFRAELVRREGEPPNALRILTAVDGTSVELLPSKGFSLAQVSHEGRQLFWDAPAPLVDPDRLDLLSDEIMIRGRRAKGFTYLKTFTAGIELLGLRNWGMPRLDERTGELHPLHGESSNIPVSRVTGSIRPDCIELRASFLYRQFQNAPDILWHQSGRPLYEVSRVVVVPRHGKSVDLTDTITNITNEILTPDWGYHITFRPEDGSRLLVPSGTAQRRGGGPLPGDLETWHPAADESVRSETGIIHKKLKVYEDRGTKTNRVLVQYPSGRGISFTFPQSPYFQTWFCNGGRNTAEFEYAETGKPVLQKNWDGQGIEIGSSALDHDGNIDESVDYRAVLEPGQALQNRFRLEILSEAQATSLCDDIRNYNLSRRMKN